MALLALTDLINSYKIPDQDNDQLRRKKEESNYKKAVFDPYYTFKTVCYYWRRPFYRLMTQVERLHPCFLECSHGYMNFLAFHMVNQNVSADTNPLYRPLMLMTGYPT